MFMRASYVLVAAVALAAPIVSIAQENGTKEEAKAMTDAAFEHVKKVGPEQAFKDFSNKSNKTFQNKDLYVFAFNMEGVQVGHGANEKLIGKNLLDVKDPGGKLIIKEMRDLAQKGGGWVEFEWPHPHTKKVQSKAAYVRKLQNFDGFVGVGAYK